MISTHYLYLTRLLQQAKVHFALILLCGLSLNLNAQENESSRDDGGFMELNFGIAALKSRFTDAPHNMGLLLNLRLNYRWNGFFIENKGNNSLGKPGVGYNFSNDANWSLDLYYTEIHDEMDPEDDYSIGQVHEGLIGIQYRDYQERLGLRATRYFDDNTALRMFFAPVSNNGPYVGLWYGKTWQVKNMNFHAIGGAQYFSRETVDYYYGVHENEASLKFPYYQGRSGVLLSGEVGVAYPLSKDWLIESSVKLTKLPTSIDNSPLVATDLEPVVQLSLTYVLF